MGFWHIQRRWLWYLCALCGFAALVMGGCHEQAAGPKPQAHGAIQQSVIGGKPDLRYPAVGGLIENGHTFCTATLIASKVVLTAAHCIDGKGPGNKINFRIDVPSQSSASGFQSHFYLLDSTRLAPHPKWTGSLSGGFDIAIVLLRTAVPANIATPLHINTVPLNKTWEGKAPLFMGFGLIASDPNAISPDTKHAVNVPIIRMRSTVFLTYGPKVSTCHGDSGGPALATAGGRFSVIGVNSYSQSARVPGSNPPRTKCDGQNGVERVDIHARFIQSYLDQYGDAPGACQSSAACSHCDDCVTVAGKKQCQRKASLRPPTSCKPCTTNADCGGGLCHRFDEGFRCLHKCPANGCCPSGTKCRQFQSGGKEDWFCVPNNTKCPPIACKVDGDCGPGELCKAGTCTPQRPPRSAKLCHPCSKNEDCPGDDALCIGPKGSGYCSQACGSADFCPQGTACQQPYRGTPKQCLAAGACDIPCTEDKDCPADFECKTNTCTRKAGGIAGDFCSVDRPCKAGLECTKTLDGMRCLQGCGVPLGEPGSLCKEGLKCNGKASCYSVPSVPSSCIQPCDSDSICNGGPCFNRVCKCSTDKDCYEGFFCNKSAGLFPSCISKKLNRPCGAGFVCQSFGKKKFCVAGTGSVAHGQPCDAFHRCRPGLVCIEGKDGDSRCLEDCTRTRGCTLGGQCSAPKDGVAVCVCKSGQCPSGSKCAPPFYLGFGYCSSDSKKTACSSRLECPAGYNCDAGKCVVAPPAPEVPEEPTPEPEPEPTPADEPPPPRPEPVVKDEPPPAPEPIVPDEPTPDAAPAPEPTPEPVKEAPKKGCGCDSTGSTPPWPGILLLLFVVAATSWRRSTCEQK